MKKNISIQLQLLLILTSIIVQAQSYQKKSYEIGIFFEHKNPFTSNSQNFGAGIMYKKSRKINTAKRYQLYFQNMTKSNVVYDIVKKNDTIYEKNSNEKINTLAIGYGIEKQRQFYKKIFLNAILEARLGYGNTHNYDNISYRKYDSISGANISYGNISSTLSNIYQNEYFLDFLPSVGAKLINKKFTLAIENGLRIRNSYLKQYSSKNNYGIYNFDIGLISFRFIATYRF